MDPQSFGNAGNIVGSGSQGGPVQPLSSTEQLGVKEQSSDQIRRLGEKVEKAPIPQDLRIRLIERVQRLALLRASAGYLSPSYIIEYESTQAFITWVISLPWEKETKDLLNLTAAKQILDKNHHGLEALKDRILEYLALIMLNMQKQRKENIVRAPILCLVGLAGTGKTTLASSIAEALGRNFERIPFGGMGDAATLRGQSRAALDAEPGIVVKKLVNAKSRNCVILLDELDRISQEARADIMGVLIELLDPEQNIGFTDHYIDYPFDLSGVLFVSTANNTANIATAVLDRLEILQMPSYTDAEKVVIGKDYLFPKVRLQTGLDENQIQIDQALWPEIIRPLGFDSGIRSLERTIEGICRKTARRIIEGKAQSAHITNQNIKEFLS